MTFMICFYDKFIFNNGATKFKRERELFQEMVVEELVSFTSHYSQKSSQKQMIDLNALTLKNIKIQKKTGENNCYFGLRKDFLDTTLNA